jgi:hypothetical protein
VFNAVTLEQRVNTEVRPNGSMSAEVRRAILTADHLGDGKATLSVADRAWKLSQRLTLTNRRA